VRIGHLRLVERWIVVGETPLPGGRTHSPAHARRLVARGRMSAYHPPPDAPREPAMGAATTSVIDVPVVDRVADRTAV